MAFETIANFTKAAYPAQSISTGQLTRLLGDWRRGSTRGSTHRRLTDAVRSLVLDARLPLGTRLPAERPLAVSLRVSRTTVSAAYGLLREEGFLRSRTGAGSWVTMPPGRWRRGAPWGPAVADTPDWLDLAVAAPEAGPEILVAVAEATTMLPGYLRGHGYDPRGLALLREEVARHYCARGLPTTPQEVLITNGAQQGLDLVIRALVSALDPVVVDCPSYPGALDALARAQTRLIPVSMGPGGFDTEALVGALRRGLPRLAYLMPDFHNPTGHLMPEATRQAVVEAARASATCLVVDETFADLALDDVGLPPPLAGCGTQATVLSLGSMSKIFWAGLRVGWVRGDPGLLARLAEARGLVDMASPTLEQLVAARLLARGPELFPARRHLLRARRDFLVGALAEHLPNWRLRIPAGGLSLWIDLGAPLSTPLVAAAEGQLLRLGGGPRFGPPGTLERFLRLPFTLPEPQLRDAVERLATAWDEVAVGRNPSSLGPVQIA